MRMCPRKRRRGHVDTPAYRARGQHPEAKWGRHPTATRHNGTRLPPRTPHRGKRQRKWATYVVRTDITTREATSATAYAPPGIRSSTGNRSRRSARGRRPGAKRGRRPTAAPHRETHPATLTARRGEGGGTRSSSTQGCTHDRSHTPIRPHTRCRGCGQGRKPTRDEGNGHTPPAPTRTRDLARGGRAPPEQTRHRRGR